MALQAVIVRFQALQFNEINVQGLDRLQNLIRNKRDLFEDDFEDRKEDARAIILGHEANHFVVPPVFTPAAAQALGPHGNAALNIELRRGKWWWVLSNDLLPGEHQLIRGAVRESYDSDGYLFVSLVNCDQFRIKWNVLRH